MKAIDVIGPLLREELRRAILRWARGKLALSPSDRFGAPPHGKIKNLKDFVAVVYDGLNAGMSPETVGGRLDLDISFVEFLRLHVRLPNGQATSVRELLTREVVPAVAMGVIEHVLMDYRLTEAESAVLNAILAEQGQESSQALVQHLNSRDHLQQVKQVVLDTLDSDVGGATLRSLYHLPRDESGFFTYGPWTWVDGEGTPKVTELATQRGQVTVTTSKYYVEDSPVQAHQWKAELMSNSSKPVCLAAAVGMVYKMPRSSGVALAGLGDLVDASDAVADTDILQVSAFINQHPDAADIVGRSNLLFVWIWERSYWSEPGDGRTCLLAALKHLRTKFAPLHAVVVNVVAEHLVSCGEFGEPAPIAADRLAALDKLDSVAQAMGIAAGVEVRCIVNRHDHSSDQDRLAPWRLSIQPW